MFCPSHESDDSLYNIFKIHKCSISIKTLDVCIQLYSNQTPIAIHNQHKLKPWLEEKRPQ